MRYPPTGQIRLTPPSICEFTQLDLAHELMQRHLRCRIAHCAWKQVAYRTLVYFGRLEPPRLSPRERASFRGIAYSVAREPIRPPTSAAVPVETFRQVLAGLNDLANGLYPADRHVE